MSEPQPGTARTRRRAARHERAVDRALTWVVRIGRVATAPFVRYEIRGGANARITPTVIIAANHRSLFDVLPGLITSARFDKLPRAMIAEQFFERRIVGRVCRAIGALPVRRGRGDRALVDVIAALRAGTQVAVMPEGRLHVDGEDRLSVGPGRSGISRLATGSGVPVMAAGLLGTDRVWPPGGFPRLNPFRRRTVVVQVADDPLYLHGDDHDANARRVMDRIAELVGEAARDHPGLAQTA